MDINKIDIMGNQKFYVIQPKNRNEYFISSNSMFPLDKKVYNALKFETLEETKKYISDLRKDRKYKIIEVNCSFKEMED